MLALLTAATLAAPPVATATGKIAASEPPAQCGAAAAGKEEPAECEHAELMPSVLTRRDKKAALATLHRLADAPSGEVFAFARYSEPRPFQSVAARADLSGVRARMGYLWTEDRFDVVSAYYAAAFKGRAFPLFAGDLDPNARYVGYRDPADGVLRVITIVDNGNGTTILAAVGEALLGGPSGGLTRRIPDGWPTPPGAGRPLRMEFQEGPAIDQNFYFEVAGTTPEDVRTFYDRELPRHGWTRAPSEAGVFDPKDPPLVFRRGRDNCLVHALRHPGGRVLVAVNCRSTSGGPP